MTNDVAYLDESIDALAGSERYTLSSPRRSDAPDPNGPSTVSKTLH